MKPGVGAVAVVIQNGRVLLIKRKYPPSAGKWAFPGGGIELGETALEAAARELSEETGVCGKPIRYLTNVDAIGWHADGTVEHHFLLAVVLCNYVSGVPVAADDATDARWVHIEDVHKLDTTENVDMVIKLATP